MTADFPILHTPEQPRCLRLATLVAMGLLALAMWGGVPPWTWALWLPAGAALVCALRAEAPVEVQLTPTHLLWSCDRLDGRVPLTQVAYVQLRRPRDGPSECTLVLRDGRSVVVPPQCVPNLDGLGVAIQARGVPLRRT